MHDYELRDGDLLISCDRARLDYDVIHGFLRRSYWSPNISMEQVQRQLKHSTLVFGLYRVGSGDVPSLTQIGFARVLSDLARFAYLADVFIVPEEQRKGLGQKLVAAVMQHPELRGIRKWLLATKDAHGVYEKLGFSVLPNPEAYMVLKNKDAQWV